jgi:hypothetical protein
VSRDESRHWARRARESRAALPHTRRISAPIGR